MLSPYKKRSASDSQANTELLNAGYRYALSLCSDAHDAEDLTQEAWLRLNRKNKKSLEQAILFTTIRNLFYDAYRKEKVEFRYKQDMRFSETGNVAHINQDVLAERALQSSLHALRGTEREALFLSVVAGYTASEISELTQKNRGTILSLLHRAKIKLKERYQKQVSVTEKPQQASDNTSAKLVTTAREAK